MMSSWNLNYIESKCLLSLLLFCILLLANVYVALFLALLAAIFSPESRDSLCPADGYGLQNVWLYGLASRAPYAVA